MNKIISWIDYKLNKVHSAQAKIGKTQKLRGVEDTLIEVKEKILELRRED